jgi:glycosyltransferase involved in cell wall biosynthesis
VKVKHLILLTSEFPYGVGETFLENELPYLEEAFEKVTILSLSEHQKLTRTVGTNTQLNRIPVFLSRMDKLLSLRHVFNGEVRKEIVRLGQIYGLRLNRRILFTVLFSWERARRIKSHLLKLVNAQTCCYAYWTDDSALALAQLKDALPNVRCVSRFHGWDVYFEASEIGYLPFRNYINSMLNAQYAISEKGKAYALERWKVEHPERIHVARLGTKKIMDKPNDGRIDIGRKVIVSCSNVIPLKRVELIFEVLNSLTEYPLHWIHIGDGPLLGSLRRKVDKEVNSHLSVTLAGRMTNEEVLQLYRRERPFLFINLSTSEGLPVSIMEAMSFGIPVIATDVGGTSEIVNNENGHLLSAHPTEGEISDALTSCVEDKEKMNLKRIAAYENWHKKYNADVNYSSFVDHLLHHS